MKILVALLAIAFFAKVNAFDRSIIPDFALESVEKCCASNGMTVEDALENCVMLTDESMGPCSPVVYCIFSELNLIDAENLIDLPKLKDLLIAQTKLMGIEVKDEDLIKAIENCLDENNPSKVPKEKAIIVTTIFFRCCTERGIFV